MERQELAPLIRERFFKQLGQTPGKAGRARVRRVVRNVAAAKVLLVAGANTASAALTLWR